MFNLTGDLTTSIKEKFKRVQEVASYQHFVGELRDNLFNK